MYFKQRFGMSVVAVMILTMFLCVEDAAGINYPSFPDSDHPMLPVTLMPPFFLDFERALLQFQEVQDFLAMLPKDPETSLKTAKDKMLSRRHRFDPNKLINLTAVLEQTGKKHLDIEDLLNVLKESINETKAG
nr:uncharacterized protein LOC123764157 [Procambarus clarkii]